MFILISSTSITLLLYKSSINRLKLHSIIIDIIKTMTNQSDVKLLKLINVKYFNNQIYRILFITLISIWIICINIITKSFTSLLLKTYFKTTFVPIVDSLEDLVKHQDMFVFSIYSSIYAIDLYKLLSKEDINSLKQRKDIYAQ